AGSRCRPGGSGRGRHRGSPGGARGAGDGRAPAGGDQGPPAAELTRARGDGDDGGGWRDGASAIERSIDRYFDHLAVERGLALTQQAASTPPPPVQNERRRRLPPPDRGTGTTGEQPPTARGSPPAPARDGPGRGPPPRGRVAAA